MSNYALSIEDEQVTRALMHLEHDDRFVLVVAYLQTQLEELQTTLMHETDERNLMRAQGGSLVLKDFIDMAKTARHRLR